MENTIELVQRYPGIIRELAEVWELSVRQTHHFLTEEDIQALKPLVGQGLQEVERLFCLQDTRGQMLAFMGVQGNKLEMLFVHPDYRAKGIGKKFVEYALQHLGVCCVDVNEQNPQAVGFYKHLGFYCSSRSEQDGQGNSFPILHMKFQS